MMVRIFVVQTVAFLLEFEAMNRHILTFIQQHTPELVSSHSEKKSLDFQVKKASVFGEAEDILSW